MTPQPKSVSDLSRALVAALQARRRHEVNSIAAQLIDMEAPLAQQWLAVARASQQNGAFNNVREATGLYARQLGSAPTARFHQAALLAEIGDIADAAQILAALPKNVPDPATHAHFAGTLALNQGDLHGARSWFKQALADRPGSGQSWLSFAEAMRGVDTGLWAHDVIAARTAMASAAPLERSPYLYALGAAFHAMKDHEQAFAAFSAGAALVKAARPYSREADRAAVSQVQSLRAMPQRSSFSTDRPIFVFGPPRSGTTLVEQILASHSAVSGGGEIHLFDIVARDLGGVGAAHLSAAIARHGIDALARDYLTLIGERFPKRGRVVDKSLSLTRFAGLAATLLPDAPLIWVRRDPLDNAWSCFRTHFNQGMAWSWDLTDIGEHLRLERQVLAFLQKLLGGRLLVLDYTALVRNPAVEVPRVLEHCRLPFEPQVLTPHETKRDVITASVSQVRSPINEKGLGVAAPYRSYLQPFVDAYGADA